MSRARDFILDEIDNRRDAGSEQSDYQREAVLALEDYDALQAEVERLRTLVAGGLEAVSAAYQQALAEARNHDRIADKHDKVVMAWKREARATLKGAPHG